MANESLFLELAKARSRPSGAFRAAQAGIGAVEQGIHGFREGGKISDEIRKRRLVQQTLGESLQNQPLSEESLLNMTGEAAEAQSHTLNAALGLIKAQKEARHRASQLFGTQGPNGLVYTPDDSGGPGSITTIPLPTANSDEPIIPKAVNPTLSPYADPTTGDPLAFTGKGLRPVYSQGGSGKTPVLKAGNAEAVKDVSMMQAQSGNIDKLFDSYKLKGRLAKGAQATPLGSVLDPETKQLENSLKLTAFTIAGKNFTENEKPVVFGALFPGPFDNDASNDLKRNLLKGLFSGKIDLYQAANLLGPSGETLRGLIQNKLQQPQTGSGTKVKVSNGQETREIDPTDIPDAFKEGYNPVP